MLNRITVSPSRSSFRALSALVAASTAPPSMQALTPSRRWRTAVSSSMAWSLTATAPPPVSRRARRMRKSPRGYSLTWIASWMNCALHCRK